eukprot:CAMPEP_0194487688 /NCGR_PEP_ID=MMETSP0253-20130528/7891_1 /TAXON_ID=2966 /ORGANISM="Noctiluca scintillans" /LENGTH=333 /DNA_ID=CAMNT_0039327945 /DNA_START=87 /DNA_END=1088 /DNA_ORIENTATION=+
MRAWHLESYPSDGDRHGVSFSTNYSVPTPGAGEVLLQVRAASVNPIDYKVVMPQLAYLFPLQFPAVMGFEGAGTVVAVGPDTSGRLRVGDEVWGLSESSNLGTYADFHSVPENAYFVRPTSISAEEAATIPLVGLTSLQALTRMEHIQPLFGKTVLILGGSGGVGSMALQLAKNVFKAGKVITTTSSAHLDFVKGCGADDAIDYHVSNWWDVLENGTVHAIFDTVGQIGTGPRATAKLAKDGVFLTIAHRGLSVGLDPNPQSNVAQIYEQLDHSRAETGLALLREYIDNQNLVRPVVQETYALEDLMTAWDVSAEGHVQGKLAISHTIPSIFS